MHQIHHQCMHFLLILGIFNLLHVLEVNPENLMLSTFLIWAYYMIDLKWFELTLGTWAIILMSNNWIVMDLEEFMDLEEYYSHSF